MGISLKKLVVLGAVGWAGYALLCGKRDANRRRHCNTLLEDGLEGTYPASDPVSTQDFGIPVNRQGGATAAAAATQ